MGSRRRAMLAALLFAFAMICTARAPGPSGGSGNPVAPRPPAPRQQVSPAQASSPAGPFPSPGAFADPIVPYDGIGRVESGGWPLLPIPRFLAGWAARDGCGNGPTTFLDSPQVTGLRWDGCHGGVSVVHYRWNGGGHGAPSAIDGVPANEVVWRFLAGYSLPAAA